jgi:hypothetical protein
MHPSNENLPVRRKLLGSMVSVAARPKRHGSCGQPHNRCYLSAPRIGGSRIGGHLCACPSAQLQDPPFLKLGPDRG